MDMTISVAEAGFATACNCAGNGLDERTAPGTESMVTGKRKNDKVLIAEGEKNRR